MTCDICLFSPFSPANVEEEHNRSLLLQFFISHLFKIRNALQQNLPLSVLITSSHHFFPYDWAQKIGLINRTSEQAAMLIKAFPRLKTHTAICVKKINRLTWNIKAQKDCTQELKELYASTERMAAECRDNENLFLFLLKQHQNIDSLMGTGHLYRYLCKLFPKGLVWLEESLCDSFHERGFFAVIPELKDLIRAIGEANASGA